MTTGQGRSRSGSSPPRTRDIQLPEAFRELFIPSRYKAYFGGRGSGKSHAMATALVLLAALKPLRILAARQYQRSIRDSSKRLIEDRIDALGLRRRFRTTEADVAGVNGSAITFAGLATNPESVKSMEGVDIAWVEEAATISQESLDILIPTIRRDASELWFSWNPRQPSDPVDALFRAGEPPPGSIVRRVSHADNPWFPAVLEAERQWDLGRDPVKHAHVWDGEYRRHAEAQIFTGWRIDTLDPPEGARPFFGADWGFAADPTVLVRCWLFDRVLFIDGEAYRVGCPIAETGALFRTLEGAGDWPITGDSARPELIDHLRREGFKIKPARKGKNSLAEGIAFLQNRDIVVHPRCRHAVDELTLYSFRTDPLTGVTLYNLNTTTTRFGFTGTGLLPAFSGGIVTVYRQKFEWDPTIQSYAQQLNAYPYARRFFCPAAGVGYLRLYALAQNQRDPANCLINPATDVIVGAGGFGAITGYTAYQFSGTADWQVALSGTDFTALKNTYVWLFSTTPQRDQLENVFEPIRLALVGAQTGWPTYVRSVASRGAGKVNRLYYSQKTAGTANLTITLAVNATTVLTLTITASHVGPQTTTWATPSFFYVFPGQTIEWTVSGGTGATDVAIALDIGG